MSGQQIETGFKLTWNGKEVEIGARTTIEQLRAMTTEATKAGAASSAAAKDYTEKLAQQAAKLGMTATEARVYEAAIRGATKADQEAVRVLSDKIEAHNKAERAIQGVTAAAKVAAGVVGTAMVAGLRASVIAAREAEQEMLKLDAVFKASGGASGMQRGQLESMAEGMKDRTGFDDDKLRGAMALLLTFRSVGRESFGAVMESAADLSRLMGQDLNSSVLMLGKALENPEHGLTALSRAGVTFSDTQKQNIKDMVESGRQAEAMTAILQTLRDQGINGVAEAMNTGLFKATNDASMAWGDLLKAIGKTDAVKGSVEGVFGSLATYLGDMKRVIEDGDWLDRLAFFTIGLTTPSMAKGNQWEGSVGGTEARQAREAQAKKAAENLADRRAEFLRRFETPDQKRDRELNNAAHLFAGSRDLQAALDAINAKYKGKSAPKSDLDRMIELGQKNLRDSRRAEYASADDDEEARLGAGKLAMQSAQNDKRQADALEKLRQKYIAMADPLQQYRVQLDEINMLRSEGFLTADQATEAEWEVNEAMDKTINKMAEMKDAGTDAFAELTKAVEGWGNKFTDTLADMVMTGKGKFSDLVNSILRDMLRMQIKESVTKPLFDWGKEILKGVFKNADGGVYRSPDLHQYANTIVSSPTLFKFAQGGAFGLMGEAGEEAIMPLKRGPGGRLGVEASGGMGGLTVNIIENSSKAGQVEQRRSGGQNMLDVFVAQVRSALASDIASGSGPVPQALANTYGLNRAVGGF